MLMSSLLERECIIQPLLLSLSLLLMCADAVLSRGLLDAALEVILTVAHNNNCVCLCVLFSSSCQKKHTQLETGRMWNLWLPAVESNSRDDK